ncbi:UNKNOWN [Stylonychia lemnae]|uniref:Uncharacterized protein n=1 Tax=Stylonychia lemnae TaxID=5949 RepID=A0A077ZY05_STYLE|nr:UNKNOWN [Stylonychia lemnae]|eukprot:CDW74765.1 UNKNOWN [Stylonychia lemnae]
MQKLVAESFRVKAHMIVEREQLFSNDDLKSKIYFPNYIVVRRPLNTEINEAGEWQGFIKDLKYTIRTSAVKSKAEIIQNLHSIQTKNNQKLDEVIELNSKQFPNEGLDAKISALNQKLDQSEESSKIITQKLDQVQENSKNEFEKQSKGVDALDVQVKGLDTKVLKIQDDMEFIKSSLTQLLQKYNQ